MKIKMEKNSKIGIHCFVVLVCEMNIAIIIIIIIIIIITINMRPVRNSKTNLRRF